jgi:hypothetical protein
MAAAAGKLAASDTGPGLSADLSEAAMIVVWMLMVGRIRLIARTFVMTRG